MRSSVKKSLLFVLALTMSFQFSFSQKKDKNKQKTHHNVSINHQGKDIDVSKGYWSVDECYDGYVLQLASKKNSKFSFKNDSFFISFELAPDEWNQLKDFSQQGQLEREAGTIILQGKSNVEEGGTYSFKPNAMFISFLNNQGFAKGTDYEYLKLFLGDVDKTYVNGIKNLGYQPTLRELGKLGILEVELDYVEAINRTQYKGLELDMLMKFAIHGVTPQYIEGLNNLGYGNIDANMVKKFAIHSISLNYIQGLKEAGYGNLDPNMIKKFAIHSISVNYIEGLNNLGYTNLDPNDIKKLAIHDVSLEYIKSFTSLDIDRPTVSDIKKAKIHGLSSRFVKRANDAGHHSKELADYVKLKIHGL